MMYWFAGWLLDVEARELQAESGTVHMQDAAFASFAAEVEAFTAS